MKFRRSLFILPVLVCTLSPAQEVNEKAQRYYDSLLKRPAPGTVFDRFYSAWLDTKTVDELEAYLKEKAETAGAPPAARLLLAFFYARQNENVKAIAQFRLAVEKDGSNAEAWYQKAVTEARTLDFDGALASLAKAAAAKPPAAMLNQIRQMQGRWLARNGKAEEAVKVWQELIAANPDDEELREDLIELQITEGLHAQALVTAQALLEKTRDPYRRVQRRMRIGDIYQRSGSRDKAIETYLLCLEETGAESWLEKEILSQVEQTFRKDDDLDGLKAEYQKLTVKHPQRVSLRRQYAKLLAETRETDQAVQEFTKILELTPGNRELREAFVDLLVQTKKSRDAASQMQELIRLNPADNELLAKLADLYFEMRQPDDCRRTVDLFLAKSDQSEASWLRAAGMLERYNLAEASLALFRRTAEKFSGSETAQDALAVALHRSGKRDEAKIAWRKLAEGDSRARVMNVARSAAARDEHVLAYEILTTRVADFGMDPLFLLQLCDTAQRVDKHAEAVPWARTLLGLSQDAVELEGNLTLLLRLAGQADQLDLLLTELKGSARTPQEKCLLAELLDGSGDPKGSETVLHGVEATHPELAAAVLVRLQIQRGDPAGAAESMKRLVESPGGRKSVHVQRLVDLYERAGKAKDALTWIPEWKKLSPGSNLPWQKEAALHFQAGNNKEALRSLRQASQEFDDNSDLKAMLADAFRQDGKLADAERLYTVLYEDAKELSDKIRWAGELAEVAQASGKITDLVEMFEERRKANRTSLQPLLALAEIYRVSENYEGRRRMLLEAARLKENDLDLLLEIARIEESEEDYPHTIETLKKAEPLDKTGKVGQRIARVYFKAGDHEKGMASLRRIADDKFDPRLAETLADSLCDQELWKEAAEFLQPLLPKNPDDYRLHYLSATALEESSQTKEAISMFQHLLTMRKELPAKTSPGTHAPILASYDYVGQMRPFVPAEVLEILRITNLSWQAYYHRQTGGRSATNRQSIRIPNSAEDSQALSLVHLASLGQSLNESEKASLTADIKAQGIKSASLLMDMIQGDRMNQQMDFADLLEKSPDDEVLLSLAAIWGSRRNGGQLDPVLDLQIYRKLKPGRPELAWLAGLRLGVSDETDAAAAYAETVSAVEKLEDPPQPVLSAAIESLGTYDNNSESIPEENRKIANRLRARLPGWYRRSDPKSSQAQYAFMSIATQLSREDDLTPFVQLFEEEITATAADPGRNARNPYFPRNVNTLLEPLSFPPSRLADYSIPVLGLLNGSSDNYYGRRMELDPEKLKTVLPAVKDFVLRLLLTARTGDDDATTKLAGEMTAQTEPSLNAFLVHAAWLASLEKYEDACALLRRAQLLPMTKDIRKLVDSSQIAWALDAKDEGELKEDSPQLAGGREAVLRMRREALTPGHRAELAGCMEQLGLKKEAERLAGSDAPIATASYARSSSPRIVRSGSFPSAGGSGGRIEQLIQKGKRDDALKELSRQLKGFSKQWISSSGNMRYQIREWTETVSRHGFNRSLLESVQPAGDAPAESVILWAAAQDILGETRKAAESYRKALALKPKDNSLWQAYIMALLADDPAKATEVIKTIDPVLVLSLGPSLSNLVSGTQTHSGRITLMELFLSVLEKVPREERAKLDLQPLLYAVESGARASWGSDEADIGSLYQTRSAAKPGESKDTPIPALQKRRLDVHQKTTALLMECPQTARRAFELHAGVALATGAESPELELDRYAAGVLDVEVKTSPKQSVIRRTYQTRNGETPIRMPDPESYLVERAWSQKRPDLITTGLLPRLNGSLHSAQVKQVAEFMTLYFCTDSEFPGIMASYLKKQNRRVPSGGPPENWMTILHIMELRNLDIDLTEAISEGLKNNGGNSGGSEYSHIIVYASRLQKTKGAEAVQALFTKLAAYALGPKEKRAELIAKQYNPNSYSSNTPNGMIMQWIRFLRSAWQSEDLVLAVAETYTREFLYYGREHVQQDQLFQYGNGFTRGGFFSREAAKVVEYFRGSRLTAPLENFMAFASPSSQRCLSVEILQNMSQAAKKPLREAFAKEPRTFGTELIDLALSKDTVTEAALTQVAAHLDEIKKLDPPQQIDIAGMLQVASRRNSFPDNKLTGAMREVKQWADNVILGTAEERLAKILSMKTLRGGQQQSGDYAFSQTLTPVLLSLVKSRPDEAVKVFLKVRSLFADARKAGMGSNGSSGDGSSVLGNILSSAVSFDQQTSDGQTAANLLSFLLRSTLSSEGFPVEWKSGVTTSASAMLRILGTSRESGEKTDDTKKEEAKFSIRRLLSKLAAVPGMHPGALLGAARTMFADKDSLMDASDIKWLEVQASGGEYRDVAAALLAGSRLANKEAKPKTITDVDAMPEEQKLLLGFINDPAVSLSVRLSVAGGLLESPAAIEAPVRCAAAIRLGEAWQQAVPVPEIHCRSIVAALSALHTDPAAQPQDPYRSAAMEVLKAWQHLSSGRSSRGTYGYQPSSSESLSASSAFSLAISVGDESLLKGLLNTAPGYVNRFLFTKLVESKHFETAQILIRSGSEAIYSDLEKLDEIAWTPALAEAGREFAAALTGSDEKYIGELLITSLPDSKQVTEGDLKGKAPLRVERLKEIAARLPGKFANPLIHERVLGMLITRDLSVRSLDSSLTAWAANQTFGTISIVEDQSLRTRRSRLFAENLKRCLARGELSAVKEVMSQIAGASGSQRSSYYMREAARPLLTLWETESPALMASSDAAVRQAVRDIWRELAFAPDVQNIFESVTSGRALHSLLYGAMDDNTAGFSAGASDLPDASRRKIAKELESATAESLARLNVRWPEDKEKAAGAKSRTILRMMQNTLAWPFELTGDPRTLRTLIERGWLRRDDVLAEAPALLARHPRNGRTAQELAVLYADANRPEEALSLIDKAATQMPKEERTAAACLGLTRSSVLERLGREQEALAILDAIPNEALDPKVAGPALKSQVVAARQHIEMGVAWRQGGGDAVMILAAKRIESDPVSAESQTTVADAFALLAGKYAAAGDKAAALHCREASFLITAKLAAGSSKNPQDALIQATKSLQEAREAAGDSSAPFEAVSPHAVWRYFEGVRDFKSWMNTAYDDSSWKSGEGPLGTGMTGTILKTQTSLIPEVMAFRTKFTLKDPKQVQSLTLQLMRGDGVAIFLNGTEIQRNNLPEGDLTESMHASASVTNEEAVQWIPLEIEQKKLAGLTRENVLSVVLYQFNNASIGLAFGLSARINDLDPPRLVSSIDKAAMEKALGAQWTKLPEAFRSTVLK